MRWPHESKQIAREHASMSRSTMRRTFAHRNAMFRKRVPCVAASACTFTIAGTKASGRVLGANDRVRVAVAGINGRGRSHLTGFGPMKDVEVAYLVDPDSRLFDSRSKIVEERAGNTPECVQDVRQALDDKNLDAVSIVTPNHWHTLMGIWACQAGKDVYVEKPCSHNIFEGRKLVEAARKYDRIVQHGTQRRSDPQWIQLIGDIRNGKYGKLQVAYSFDRRERRSIGIKDPQEPPRELDFDLWLGPAPDAAVPHESRALQVALDVGLRQRRDREPGVARTRRLPLGHARRCGSEECRQPRRSLRL